MNKKIINGDGNEKEFDDSRPAELESKTSRLADDMRAASGPPDMRGSDGGSDYYEALIKEESDTLQAIAYNRIQGKCSDPHDHKFDVVQEGIKNFLQSVGNRASNYDTPAKVLRAAVWQVGLRHSQTCPREQAVDFNASSSRRAEARDAVPPDPNAREISRKTSYNPLEALDKLVELKQRLLGVADIDLFIRYFEEGKTLEEISKERGCSVMTVQRALHRLKRDLGLNNDD